MKAAVVQSVGQTPIYTEFEEPVVGDGEVRITVTASALTTFVRMRAGGKHYSFDAEPPFVVGIDGVGHLDDGRRVYFLFPRTPFGGMAERTVVPATRCTDVPDDLDDATLAALADPGMSAWVALEARARIGTGDTVLINGATGFAGQVAIRIAKHLGAAKVIATGRNRAALHRLTSLGADEIVVLDQDGHAPMDTLRHQFRHRVDIVLDYLWGPSALQIIEAASAGDATRRIRFVQLGLSGGTTVALPGTLLRSSAIEIMGSGTGSVAADNIFAIIRKLMLSASTVAYDLSTTIVPLSQIEIAWSATDAVRRIIFDTRT